MKGLKLMDYFNDIMQGINEDTNDVTTEGVGVVAASAIAKGATAIAGSVASSKAISAAKYRFDSDVKKDIQRKVKLEMKLKKINEKNGVVDDEVVDEIKDEIKDLDKRIKRYKKGLSNSDTVNAVDGYINKCAVDYGPTSLYYATVKVPMTKAESFELLDDGDLISEKKNDVNNGTEVINEHITLVPATKSDIPNMAEWTLETIKNSRSDSEMTDDEYEKQKKDMVDDAKKSVHKTRMIQYDGKTIGMITAYNAGKQFGNDWYIAELYLDKSHRGSGIGTAILKNEIENHDSLRLNVYKNNTGAISLYKSLGFKVKEDDDERYIMRLAGESLTESVDDTSEYFEGSDVRSELVAKIENAFADSDYNINISDKAKDAFINNKRHMMSDANCLCVVLGKNGYNEKKKILDSVISDYSDDFKNTEDNYFTNMICVKPKSPLYMKDVRESVYSMITDDIDTFIESTDIFEKDIYDEAATAESEPPKAPTKFDVGDAGANTTPTNENDTPETEENCIGAMLPQCGSTDGIGDPNTVVSDVNKLNKNIDKSLDGIELPDDIEIEESINDYINNLDLTYDVYVEAAVSQLAEKIKTNAELSKDAVKAAADKAIAKARYNKARLAVKKEELKDEMTNKLNAAKSNFVDAEKRFRYKRNKLDEESARELSAVAEKVLEKFNSRNIQEAAEFNTIKVENFFSAHKKIKKACKIYEAANPSITPFDKLIEKPCIKSMSGDMIYIDPNNKKLARKGKDKSKGYEYYSGKELTFKILKDVEIDSATRLKPSFSIQQGFDLELQFNKFKTINVVYSAVSNEGKNHIDYYVAAWMAKQKLGNNDVINWANYIISSRKKLMKEGFELVDERDEVVLQLEKAMNENNLEAITVLENKIKYIDNREKKLGLVVTLEATNIDAEIKPIIEELNRKGYTTKYSSAGHTKLRKKEDTGKDGVYYGKLYSDARIMFADDFDFPRPPKHWTWKTVDGKDYLDVIPQTYNSKDGTPDEAFAKWKVNYMGTLRTWVDNLPDRSKTDDKVIVKDTKGREKVNE